MVGYKNITGAFADSAILFPLLALLSTQNGFSESVLLFSAGLTYCMAGLLFKVPMPVQPLKSMVMAAITLGATLQEVKLCTAAMGAYCLLVVFFKLHNFANKIPLSLVHGLQAGLGIMMLSKGSGMLTSHAPMVIGFFITFLVLMVYVSRSTNFPILGILATGGLLWGLFTPPIPITITAPASVPLHSIRLDLLLYLILPQIILTSANSVIGTQYAAQKYFGERAKNVTFKRLLWSIGVGNLLSSTVGGLPFCHGAGGLTAHVKGGSTHWMSNWVIGLFLIALAVISYGLPLFHFPPLLVALLLSAVGLLHVELAKESWKQKPLRSQIMVMGATALMTQNMLWVLGAGLGHQGLLHLNRTLEKRTLH
ncbi:MAG: hypothetical protein HY559_04175 [Gammaproteobacteria bacterium]|nr:hypothetical protein [Gammaproteobacteria bacterium]